MEHFVYPAVFYYDREFDNYAVAFPDVSIYTDGSTIEEAYKNAQGFLLSYIDCCAQIEEVPNKPSDYQKVVEENKTKTVMLVAVDYDERGRKEVPHLNGKLRNDVLETIDSDINGSPNDKE